MFTNKVGLLAFILLW